RSHAELVATFEGVFPTLLGELHQPVAAARQRAPGAGPYVTLQQVHVTSGKASRSAKRLSEAHAIAELIADLVANEVPVCDPQSGEERPVRYGDIAILARGKAPFETYAQVLPALGVPTVDTGGGNLLETREAKDGVAALRFLADPHDDMALAAVLRGPFFALDDRALLALADSLPRGYGWWQAVAAVDDPALER